MKRVFWLALMTTLFGLGAVVAFYNTTPVTLDYLGGQSQRPLILWLLLSFVLGCTISLLVLSIRNLRLGIELRHLRRRLDRAETELKTLRSLPLKEN